MEAGLRLLRYEGELNRDHVNSRSLQQYVCRAIACSGKAIESIARPAGADSVQIRAGTSGSRAAWSVSTRSALRWYRADGRWHVRTLTQQTASQPPMSVHRVMPVMERVCHRDFPSRWSILLTFKNLMELSHAKSLRRSVTFSEKFD
jgi:hypothetical protein